MLPMNYPQSCERFVVALEDAAAGHDVGDFSGLHAAYDELAGLLTPASGPEFDGLHIALAFLDGWSDAHNHGWLHYDGISQRDWPRLARAIAVDLRANR